MALYGWDDLLKPKNFGLFLQAIKSIWIELSENDFGICHYCKKEDVLNTEHRIIVSYEFGPVVKFYEHFEMDGSVFEEVKCCRNCAQKMLTNLASKMDENKETFWV